MLAGRAWEDEFNQLPHHATAPRFRHATGIQVITSEGSIAGRISKRLPDILTTERGLIALQKATKLSDEAMELLDEEAALRGAKISEQRCIQQRTGRSSTLTIGIQQSEHLHSNKRIQQNVHAATIELMKQQPTSSNAPKGLMCTRPTDSSSRPFWLTNNYQKAFYI